MVPGMAEAERAQEFAELAPGCLVDGEFEEFRPVEARWRGQCQRARAGFGQDQ